MASPLLDGVIRDPVIHAKFFSTPSVAPRIRNEAALDVLDVLTESLKSFDKDLIRLVASCAYKKSPVNVHGLPDGHVLRSHMIGRCWSDKPMLSAHLR
jgi:hypothetical protein